MIDRKTKRLIQRLEAENAVLKQQNDKHLDVYRSQCLEIIDLKAQWIQVRELAEEIYSITN